MVHCVYGNNYLHLWTRSRNVDCMNICHGKVLKKVLKFINE